MGLFASPIAKIIPSFATAPAFIIVVFLMLNVIGKLDFEDYTEALALKPATVPSVSKKSTMKSAKMTLLLQRLEVPSNRASNV